VNPEDEPKPKCEIVVDWSNQWRIEYNQQGVHIKHDLTAKTRDHAIREAVAQGFRVIRIYKEPTVGHLFADGTIIIPRENG
jgi:hypothetical protein